MIVIRKMNAGDIPLGLTLCRFAGWNQLEADWRRLLDVNPHGLFVAERDGVACGTGSVMTYGIDLAWIGMILVHPEHRGNGVATALIRHTLAYLKQAGIRCAKLDATDQGRAVYSKLDFEDERPICRYLGPNQASTNAEELPSIAEADWPDVARLDGAAFGADRISLLRHLAGDGVSAVVRTSGNLRGYGFARRGHNAGFLGPIVAADPEVANTLAHALLARLDDAKSEAYWDLLPDNLAAKELAESMGFRVDRTLTRMRSAAPSREGQLEHIFAAAGFETG